jgi:hypothetical protein
MAYKVCEMSHYVKVGLVFVFIELLFHLNMMIHDGTGGSSDTQHEEEDEEHVERGEEEPITTINARTRKNAKSRNGELVQ